MSWLELAHKAALLVKLLTVSECEGESCDLSELWTGDYEFHLFAITANSSDGEEVHPPF